MPEANSSGAGASGSVFASTAQFTLTGRELNVLRRTVKVPGQAEVSSWAGAWLLIATPTAEPGTGMNGASSSRCAAGSQAVLAGWWSGSGWESQLSWTLKYGRP